MYKLLVVDDEPLIIAGIKSMIEWEKYNVEIIASALNGELALKLITELKPDIIITDIKMPRLTGIELIEKCHEIGMDHLQFIVLSSYEDFNSVRQAMRFNTVDYLVKLELTGEILIKSIDKAISRISKFHNTESKNNSFLSEIKVFQEIFLIKLINNVFKNREEIIFSMDSAGLNFTSNEYLVSYSSLVFNNKSLLITDKKKILISTMQIVQNALEKHVSTKVLPIDHENFVSIIGFNKDRDSCLDNKSLIRSNFKSASLLAEKYYNIKIESGIGSIYKDLEDIHKSYSEARVAKDRSLDRESVSLYQKADSKILKLNADQLNKIKEKFKYSLESYNIDLLNESIDLLYKLLESDDTYLADCFNICSYIIFEIKEQLSNGEELLKSIFKNDKNSYNSLYDIAQVHLVLKWIGKLKSGLLKEFKDKRIGYTELLATQIKKYIDRNCIEKLELKDIGNHFNMSPNYLCSVFKKYNKYGISYYQNLKKVEKAKELLNQKVYKIYDVSEMTGFESQYYFSKVFKRITGVSPSSWSSENEINAS